MLESTMVKPSVSGLTLALGVCCFSAVASATEFTITLRNTTSSAAGNAQTWSTGLLTTTELMTVGSAPTETSPHYPTYQFISAVCNNGTDDGNVPLLAMRKGITLEPAANANGWTIPSLGPGTSYTVTINATTPQRLYYIARVDTFTDDFVSIREVGQPNTLSAPLFDSAGLPVAPVRFDLGGYDVATSTQGDGTGVDCSAVCPPPATGCWVAPGNGTPGGGTLPAQPTPLAMTNPWNYTTSGLTTDGLALGDITGSTAKELVFVAEAGKYTSTYDPKARGRAYILSNLTGASPTATFFAAATDGHDFMGLPLIENLTSTSIPPAATGEHYVVPEYVSLTPAPGAAVYARGAAGPLYTSTGHGYPGFWNMGASTGNVRSDVAGNQLIIPTWTGDLMVLNKGTGAQLNAYDFFASETGENLYGHVAVGDVLGNGGQQIVAVGAATGRAYVLTAGATGAPSAGFTVNWRSTAPGGLYAFGSGPAISNLDLKLVGQRGRIDIIVAGAGSNRVYAYDPTYDPTGGCKYQWTVPGATDFAWTSPVVADVDGDGREEILVLSSNAILAVLKVPDRPKSGCATGTVAWTHVVGNGGSAWFTPALADLVGTSAIDVVVANYNTVEVIDVQARQVAFRFNDPSANFFPSAVIERRVSGTTSPAASIYVSSWANGKVYRLTTPSTANVPVADWPTFMGNNQRTGAR